MPVIKIDSELLERVKNLIKKGDKKYDYPSIKSFVDKAVLMMLKKE